MKIQKLTIHNIASIEDAEIDFSAKPLVDSDVFLITGKTGAGKSTILDAICLALYNKTPRLYNTRMQGAVNDAGKEVQLDDPAQLLRENTGEGFVRLSFEGSDGIPYEAEWSIARARNKPSGRLQGRKWNVKDLQSGMQYTKVDEIGAVIADAVKLNFEQFCRTTMLAQGEFTRFLNSKDEEKAEILEMITGADIYSKIGAKVYEITQQKRSAYETAKSAVEGIHLLTEDEKKEKLDSIEESTRQSKEAEALRDEATKKKSWLEALTSLQKNLEDAEAALSSAVEANDTDDSKAERALILSYRQTEAVRGQLSIAVSEDKSAAGAKSRIDALAEDYVTVRKGEAFLKDRREDLAAEQEEVRLALEKDVPLAPVLEKAQTLDAYAKAIVDGRGEMATLEGKIALKEKEISETLEPARKAASEGHTGKVTAREATQKAVTDAEQALRQANLGAVRSETKALMQESGFIRVALERIKHLEEAQRLRQEEKDAIDAKEKELSGKATARDTLKTTVASLQVSLESAKGLFDAASRAGETYVIGLRRKLSVGDVCPVCFQKIEKALPTDKEVEAQLQPLEEVYANAKKAYDEKSAELVQAEADLTTEQNALTARMSRFEKDNTLQSRLSDTLSALRDCGHETLEKDTKEILQKRIGVINVRLGELSALETAGRTVEKALESARENDSAAEQEVAAAKKEFDDATDALNTAINQVNTAKARRDSKKESVQNAITDAQEILRETAWAETWQEDILAFRNSLKEKVNGHNANLKKQSELATTASTVDNDLRSITTALATVFTIKPEWKEADCGEPVEAKDLVERADSLRDDLIAENRTYTEASKKAKAAERQVEDFLAGHPELGKDTLVRLSAYSVEDIQSIEASQKRLSDALVSAKTTRDNAEKELSEHQAAKPELSEEDTVESLAEVVSAASQHVIDIATAIGVVKKELSDDEENQTTLGSLAKEADKKLSVYTRWYRLNDLLGDQTGKRFRKIAQSYVLGSLVAAANHYMHDLTDRYVLKVEPGTFIITLEDAYQGYVSRAASTISGGESFLVSLSLALALSDIGDTLSVDTLFIDEGFGTLSGEPLQNAVNTLKTLRTKAGRHVGIISHIEELQEKIPVRIQVEQNDRTASSTVKIVPEV